MNFLKYLIGKIPVTTIRFTNAINALFERLNLLVDGSNDLVRRVNELSLVEMNHSEELSSISKEIKSIETQICLGNKNSQMECNVDEFCKMMEYQKVFSLLSDRESEEIFKARIAISQNDDIVPLFRFLMKKQREGNPVDIISLLREKINGERNGELILFGTSIHAKQLYEIINGLGIKVDYICKEDDITQYTRPGTKSVNTSVWGKTPVITEMELINRHKDANVIIGDVVCSKAKNDLIKKGFPEGNIYRRHTEWERQYFAKDIMVPGEHEVFIDGGCLNLKNSTDFIDWCNGKYDHIYAFEPEEYRSCQKILNQNDKLDADRINLLDAAIYQTDGEISFLSGQAASSRVDNKGNVKVKTRSIDSVLKGEKVTFIKLDIEGAEMDALMGAKESITKWKPRLAICIYHKKEDITDIPLYIHGLVPEYKMYIRHYSTCIAETVLYCVLPEHIGGLHDYI